MWILNVSDVIFVAIWLRLIFSTKKPAATPMLENNLQTKKKKISAARQ
jgi:hypothetical protein